MPAEDIPDIRLGMTWLELETALDGKTFWAYRASRLGSSRDHQMASVEPTLTHEFTVALDGEVIRCASSRVIEPTFYFVFMGNTLDRIRPASQSFRADPGPDRVRELLHEPSITTSDIAALVHERVAANAVAQGYADPLPIPFFLHPSGDLADHYRLEARFDPVGVGVGMAETEVEQQLGVPVLSRASDSSRHIRVYGEPAVPNDFVAVTYEGGFVVEVYSHDFLDQSLISDAIAALGGTR